MNASDIRESGRMKMLILGAIVIGGVLACVIVLKVIRFETYVLPDRMTKGWVAIEFGNATCGKVGRDWLGNRVVIPESRYICFSDAYRDGLSMDRYLLEDDSGTLKSLERSKWIHVRGMLSMREDGCSVLARVFWYGPEGQVEGQPEDLIRQHHPECKIP